MSFWKIIVPFHSPPIAYHNAFLLYYLNVFRKSSQAANEKEKNKFCHEFLSLKSFDKLHLSSVRELSFAEFRELSDSLVDRNATKLKSAECE